MGVSKSHLPDGIAGLYNKERKRKNANNKRSGGAKPSHRPATTSNDPWRWPGSNVKLQEANNRIYNAIPSDLVTKRASDGSYYHLRDITEAISNEMAKNAGL